MLAAAQVYAAGNQATIITPFILAGAMAPVTTAGVAAQTLAEALAGMTFVQLVRPGAPVVFGSFASSMSMQTGAPTFGTPEPSLVLYVVRPARPAPRRAVPIGRIAVRVEAARRAGGVRVGQHAAGDRARRRQLRAPRRGLARGRPRDRLREVRPRRRPARDDGHVRARRRPLRERPGARRHPRERTRAALPRHRAHARQLRERLLPVDDRRQRELRAVARRRRARRRAARQRDLEAAGSPSTSRRRSTPRSTRSCATFVDRRKSEMPDEIG